MDPHEDLSHECRPNKPNDIRHNQNFRAERCDLIFIYSSTYIIFILSEICLQQLLVTTSIIVNAEHSDARCLRFRSIMELKVEGAFVSF